MAPSATWQLERGAAERYAEVLVPAILGPFARALVERAGPRAGEAVLDVGCGSGAAACRAAARVGRGGAVVGVDPNPAMLEVARASAGRGGAAIAWRAGRAEALPFPDAAFDLVLCAQTLQFVGERELALREMRRVARAGGRLAVSAWCGLPDNPYFDAVAQALVHLGADAPSGLLPAFALSDADALRRLFARAGLPEPALAAHELALELPPADAFVPRHLGATPVAPLYARATQAARAKTVAAARERLAPWTRDGVLRVPFRSWIALAAP